MGEVLEAVAHLVLEKALHFGEVDEVGNRAGAEGGLQEIADGGAVRIAAGEGCEVGELEALARLPDGIEDDVGGVEALALGGRGAAGEELGLEGDPAAVLEGESPLDGFPEVRKVVGGDRHGEGDGQADFPAAPHGAFLHFAQVGAAQFALARFLQSVELEVELEVSARDALAELGEEFVVLRDEDPVGVDEGVVDPLALVDPVEELEELRVEGGLPARELEDLDVALAVEDTADAFPEFLEGMVLQAVIHPGGRVREAGGAGEIAGVDDFDQGEAGGELLDGVLLGEGVPAERAGGPLRIGRAGASRTAAVPVAIRPVFVGALREPVEAGRRRRCRWWRSRARDTCG